MRLTFQPVNSDPLVFTVTKKCFVVGRSPTCDVSLVVDGISRRHCQIEYTNGDVYVTDLDSTNGVFIDGKRIKPNIPVRYQTFLNLSIGSIPTVNLELPDTSRFSLASWSTGHQAPTPADPNPRASLTRTRPLAPPRPAQPAVKVHHHEDSSSWVINVLAFLILAGGMAFFFFTHAPSEKIIFKPKSKNTTNINDNGHF